MGVSDKVDGRGDKVMKSKIISIFLCMTMVASISASFTRNFGQLSTNASGDCGPVSSWPMFHQNPQHTGLSSYIGAQAPDVKWTYPNIGEFFTSDPIIDVDGTIYVGGKGLYAINPDGTLKWYYNCSNIESAPAVDSSGVIYFGCSGELPFEGIFYALYPNGTLKWDFYVGDRIWDGPTIGPDGTIYFAGSYTQYTYAMNPDGSVKWIFDAGENVLSAITLGFDGTIYFGGRYNLFALYPNGSLKWKYYTGWYFYSSPAIGSDGTIYIGCYDYYLHALNPDGSVKWTFLADAAISTTPAIDSNGIIYIGTDVGYGLIDGKVFAIYPNGSLKWTFQTAGKICKSAPAIGADGMIYITGGGTFYALNQNGSLNWEYDITPISSNQSPTSSPSIASDGTTYIVGIVITEGSILYAFSGGPQHPMADAGCHQTVNEGEIVQFEGCLDGTDIYERDITFKPAVKVNQGPDGVLQWYPAVAANDTGRAHVAWEVRYDHINTSRSSDGLIFTDETTASYSSGPELPWIATYADDIVHIIWSDALSANTGIWLATSNDGGVTFQTPVRVRDDGINGTPYDPFVIVDESGVVYTAWFDTRNDKWDVYFAKSTDGGATFSENVKVNDDSQEFPQIHGNNCPKIVIDDDGTIYIVWTDNRNGDFDIYFSKSSDGGNNFTANVRVNDDFSGEKQLNPTLAIGTDGTLHIAWTDNRAGEHIYYASSTDGGATFSTNKMVSDGVGALWERAPSLAMDREYNILYLAWNYIYKGGNNGDILFSKSIDNGNSFSPSIVIDDSSGKLRRWYPDMTIDILGNIHITWQDGRNVHKGVTDWDIFYVKGDVNDDPFSELSYTWDFNSYIDSDGDGYFTNDIDASGPTPTHIYGDDGFYLVTLTVTDKQNSSYTDTCVISVTNLAPAIGPFGPFVADQGEPKFFSATAIDPGSDDLLFTWEWGDGTSNTYANYFNNGTGVDTYPSPWGNLPFLAIDTVQHIYQEDGVYTINLTVEDDDGGISVYSTSITVNMVAISPPVLYLKTSQDGEDVILYWDPPSTPGVDHYLIYRSTSQTGFDFNTVWVNTSGDNEPGESGPMPLRTMWNDTGAASIFAPEEYYYTIRAVNTLGMVSSSSRTVGKWTRTFPMGVSAFSLPLEPFESYKTDYYTTDMNADYIKYMDPFTHTWTQHNFNDGNTNNIEMKQGQAYEVKFAGLTEYTFTGMPGAMISYDDDTGFLGFDHVSEAKDISVSIQPNGDVDLSWQEPVSMGTGDWYEVYYSNSRDGFFGILDVDYFLISQIDFGTNTITHTNAQANSPGARLYYMVVPFNSLGIRGSSTYSIGIWTEEYLSQYDTFGIPLKPGNYQTADWFCDSIPDTVGMNFHDISAQRWSWHSTRMPASIYDPFIEMTEGYQISTSSDTGFTFVGT
jgi:outer membrane protein assembly factor BamB